MTPSTSTVSAREAYQLLKDIALGTRTVQVAASPIEIEGTLFRADGWQITLLAHDGVLRGCLSCESPDGRTGSPENWQRFGTDPVSLLSAWEQAQIEALL
jgi:hypothetical protein